MTYQDEVLNELKAQRAILTTISHQLEVLARAAAPLSPNYRRRLSEYHKFDWSSIDAEVLSQDQHGPTEVLWHAHRWTRRRSKGEDDDYGEAIWYSRHQGGKEKLYHVLIKFADYRPAKKVNDDLVKPAAKGAPGAPQEVTPVEVQRPAAESPAKPQEAFYKLATKAIQAGKVTHDLIRDLAGLNNFTEATRQLSAAIA